MRNRSIKAQSQVIIFKKFMNLLNGLPLEAYDYIVNCKPALEWIMERCFSIGQAAVSQRERLMRHPPNYEECLLKIPAVKQS